MNHVVYCLRPLATLTKRDIAWQCLMVEYGIDFAFDDRYTLPADLPDDLTGVKVVLIDPASWAGYHTGMIGRRLRDFARAGGIVHALRGPEQFDAVDEQAIRGDLEMIAASADLTLDHPALRARLQARSFRQLYDELRDGYFLGQVHSGLKRGVDHVFAEPYSFGVLQTMELFDEYAPAFGWGNRLRQTLDAMITLAAGMPGSPNLDYTSGLDVFVRMAQTTGDEKYLHFARNMTEHVVATYPRIADVPVLCPGRDLILWNECLATFSPACVAVGVAVHAESLIDLAIHAIRTMHELNYDPDAGLWRHWGAPGRNGPAIWARGQAWALTGLVGVLRHLPVNHPDRGAIIHYVGQIVDGLATTQSAEGLWHNVLNDPHSRVCARASAMFCYLLADARRRGWADGDQVDSLLARAWRGVRGRVYGDKLCMVCCGTGAGRTYHHYLSRPTLFYGASSALRAGVSYVLAMGRDLPS